MNPYLFYTPTVLTSVSGLILCWLVPRGHPVLSALAGVCGASPWLFYLIMHGRLHLPSAPQWLGEVIFFFSMFGPGVLFSGVMAAVALSKDENKRRKTSLLWAAAAGLIASTLHAMASWLYAAAS
ncbi:MAG: hypothetical protein V4819_18380 [Verrucomicrobiota bacterium]